MKHTRGPWKVRKEPLNPNVKLTAGNGLIVSIPIPEGDLYKMFDKNNRANADRIVACVNGCDEAGISDPSQLALLVDAISDLLEEPSPDAETLAALRSNVTTALLRTRS